MNDAHLHLVLTHLPVLGTFFGAGLAAHGLLFRKPDVLKVALGVFVIAALLAGAAYLTGEGAEEAVERIGIGEQLIEAHESVAVYALVGAGALGLMALVGLVAYRDRTVARSYVLGVMTLALGVAGLMAYTANLGGQIRHVEIRSGPLVEGARAIVLPGETDPDRDEDDD